MKYTFETIEKEIRGYIKTMAKNFEAQRSPYTWEDYAQEARFRLWMALEAGKDGEKLAFYKSVARNAMRDFRKLKVKHQLVCEELRDGYVFSTAEVND